MSQQSDEIAWIEGRIVPVREARIPVLDHGFLFGDGVFEGIRLTRRGIFRFDDHLGRLATAARAVGIEVPGGFDRVRDVARETTRAWGARPGYLRLILSRGVGALGIDPASCPEASIVCIAAPDSALAPELEARGLDLVTASLRRPSADVLDPRIKSLNYLNNVLAKREATLRGADDALVLNARGLVAEASATNVFLLQGERLETPPVTDGALEGITRRTVLEIGLELGFEVSERSLGRFDLYAADGVFLTGSRAGLVPVGSLDGSAISQSARPAFAQIREAFEDRVERLSTPVD
ncbi:MAG: aminotransferase class IV [Deltaproteobacteria bacterium]|nr:aminotransferase class IV [Deltaproteobacteria bacterium]